MKPVFLHHLSKRNPSLTLTLETRLPEHIISPCLLHCHWKLETMGEQYILSLHLEGNLNLFCQRCAQPLTLPYTHANRIALCTNTQELERLMPELDCLLLEELPERLEDIVTDELHLYSPDRHPDTCPNSTVSA